MVVLTSRNEDCHTHAPKKSISLLELSDAEACELLLRVARIPLDQAQILEDDARKVATLLRSHPLALIQAGSYIARGHSTMADYPRVFVQKRERLLAFPPAQAKSRYQDVYATFEASAAIMQSTKTEAATDALQILPVLATFDSNRLPLPLFAAGWEVARVLKSYFNSVCKDAKDADDSLSISEWHISSLLSLMQVDADQWDSFRLIEAIDLLKSFSLVTTDTHSGFLSVSMHPLVHAWARDRQDSGEQNSSWITSGCIMALSRRDKEFWLQHGRQLRPHLHAFTAWDTSHLFMCHPPMKIAYILLVCGWLLYKMQDTALVNSLLQSIFSNLGLDMDTVNTECLQLYALLAENLQRDGRLNIAIMLFDQIVTLQEEIYPANHRNLSLARHRLAAAYQDNGQFQEAIILLEQVLKDLGTLKEDQPDRLHLQHELARAYDTNGQIQEALTLLEQVVRIRDQILREDHPDRLASHYELARAYRANGQVEEAISLLEQVARIEENTLREDHPNRLTSQGELAEAYKANGQVEKAISLSEKVARIQEDTLRENHPDRLVSQHNLAVYYWGLGRCDTAYEMMAHVVKVHRQMNPEHHPERINSEEWLRIFQRKTNCTEAE